MSRDIFVKKLGSQESGYSGDKPNQRGKYILIAKRFYDFFPYLSKDTLNDQAVITCKTPSGAKVAANVVYHNAKYFPDTHQRDHNEIRLYRSSKLDEALNLDRNVIVIASKFDDGTFGFVSVQERDVNYKNWIEIEKKAKKDSVLYDSVKSLSETKQLMSLSNKEYGNIQNSSEVIQEYTKRLIKSRKQQSKYIHSDDPASPLQSLFNSQSDFSNYIRMMYDGKCALRKAPLVLERYVGLEAAHIHPHSHQGPLLPTNGILLSRDLHVAFEDGFFTLNNENKVMVSNKVPKKSSLRDFDGILITPIEGYEIYEPFSSYTKWHRDKIFERRF
jgi:hypothetical protein